MNIDELIELQSKQQKELAEHAAVFKSKLTDKALPLDERWHIFEKLCNISGVLPMGRWICHSIDEFGLSWYDDFYYERPEDVYYPEAAEQMLEKVEHGDFPRAAYDAWREKILAQGKRGFNYDW